LVSDFGGEKKEIGGECIEAEEDGVA